MYRKQTAPAVTLAVLCLLLGFSFFLHLSRSPLSIWDEGRRAADALQMLQNGQWLITFYDDNPNTWGTKSPLLLWLQVLSMQVFGINEWAIRFPSAILASLVGISIWYFGKRHLQNVWTGFLAGSVFAGTFAWVANHAGRSGDYDALLTFFTTLYALCFYLYCVHQRNRWLQLFWLFITLAVFSKGVAGLFLVPGILVFVLKEKRLRLLISNRWTYLGALFFVLFIGGYYALREYMAPGFLKAMAGNELGGRFLGDLEENARPFSFYFRNLVGWRYQYWIWFLVPAFAWGLLQKQENIRRLSLFSLLSTTGFLLIISGARTKLVWYDLPVYPFFALQIGMFLNAVWKAIKERMPRRNQPYFVPMTGAALYSIILAIPFWEIKTHNAYIIHDEPWEFDVVEKRPAKFMKYAIETGKDLNQVAVLFDGVGPHITFYAKKLQAKGVDVRVINNPDDLVPGMRVVVAKPELVAMLEQKYQLKKEEEVFDCVVYLVESLKNAGTEATYIHNPEGQ